MKTLIAFIFGYVLSCFTVVTELSSDIHGLAMFISLMVGAILVGVIVFMEGMYHDPKTNRSRP